MSKLVRGFVTRVRWLLRMAKAAASDRRLPRGVRWLFAAALAIKCIPFPDFGLDEAMLLVGMLLLLGPYRRTWRIIRAELL